MYNKFFGKKKPSEQRDSSNNNEKEKKKEIESKPSTNKNEKPAVVKQAKKKVKKKKRVKEDEKVEVPPIGVFVNGYDSFGNKEDSQYKTYKFELSLLEDLTLAKERTVFLNVFSFLTVPETVTATLISKTIRIGLRDSPLRLDSLSRVIRMPIIEEIYKPVRFPDGLLAAPWHVSGVICNLSNLNELFKCLDPTRLVQLGIAGKDLKDISPIARCTNLEKLESHQCANLEDIRPLERLDSLKIVIFIKTIKLADISPLAKIKNLSSLSLWGCEALENIAPLAKCSNITRLGITQNKKIRDFSPLKALKALEILDLSENENLKTLDCLPRTSELQHLYLGSCVNLENIEALREHCENLKLLKMNECKLVSNISPLENAADLVSLTLTDMTELKSFAGLEFPKLRFFMIEKCQNVEKMAEFFVSLRSVEAVILKGCSKLQASDAEALLECRKLYVFECSEASASFLVPLLKSGSIVMRKAAEEALVEKFKTPYLFKHQLEEAESLVQGLIGTLNFTLSDKESQKTNAEQIQQLVDIIMGLRNVATGLLSSTDLFRKLVGSFNLPESIIPEKVKSKITKLLFATVQADPQSCALLMTNPYMLEVFLTVIHTSRTQPYKGNPNNLVHYDIGVACISIVAVFLDNIRRCLFEDLPTVAQNGNLRVKLNEIALLKLIETMVERIESSGVLVFLLELISLDYPAKEHQGSAYKFLNSLTTAIQVNNRIRAARNNLNTTKNEDVVLTELKVPKLLIDKGVPSILKSIPQMEISVKVTSYQWIIQLLEEGGEEAAQKLLEEKQSVMQMVQEIFIYSVSAMVSKVKEGADFPLETITQLIDTGTQLVSLMPKQIFYDLLDPASKVESVRLIVHLIEFHIDLIGQCIIAENQPLPSFLKYFDAPLKSQYVKHANMCLKALISIAFEPAVVQLLVKSSEKIPGVVASLLHVASDELSLFDNCLALLLKLSRDSTQFKSKLQYLYTNSDVTVALKLFMDPEPQQRPRVAKTLDQKRNGLELLGVLLESQVLCTKFLDYNGKELDEFSKQYRRFVYQVQANKYFQDLRGIQLAGEVIGKLISAESNDSKKIKGVVSRYIFPVLADYKAIQTSEKLAELKALEEEAINFDSLSSKAKGERQPMNTLTQMFSSFLGSMLPSPVTNAIDTPEALAKLIFGGQELPEVQEARVETAPGNAPVHFGPLMQHALQKFTISPTLAEPNLLQQRVILNYIFRIAFFLSCCFDEANGNGFAGVGAIDESCVEVALTHLHTTNDLARMFPTHDSLKFEITLVKAATARFLSAILRQMLHPTKGKAISRIADNLETEQVVEVEPELEERDESIFPLFRFQPFDNSARVREQLEAQKRAAASEVRLILSKQRQLNYVKKLAKDLNEEKVSEKAEKRRTIPRPDAKMLKNIDLIWNVVSKTPTTLDKFVENVVALLSVQRLDFAVVASFSLLSALCKVSMIKKQSLLVDIAQQYSEILESIERDFVLLEKSGGFVKDFFLLLAEENEVLTYQLLGFIVTEFSDYSKDGQEKRLFASRMLLNILQEGSEESEKVKKVLSGEDWVLPSKLAEYVSKAAADVAEVTNCYNVLKILSLLLEKTPENLIKLLEASKDMDAFPSVLVQIISKPQLTTDPESITTVALRMLRGVFDGSVEKVDVEGLALLAGKLLEAGILDLLPQFWRSADGSRKVATTMNEWDKLAGLTVVEVASISGHGDLLQKESDIVVPTILELLMEKPTSKLAKTLISIDPNFGFNDSPLLSQQLSKFAAFSSAVDVEKEVLERQTSVGDIVVKRIRGLPHEVEGTRKYHFTFKKAKSTVAVSPESFPLQLQQSTKGEKIYFEVEIIKDKIQNMKYTTEPLASVGLISSQFAVGALAGALAEGVGDAKETSCALVVGAEFRSKDVVGVLIDMESSSVSFQHNGANELVIPEAGNVLQGGFYPAISGQNIQAKFNFGQAPFKYSPTEETWKSYKAFVKH